MSDQSTDIHAEEDSLIAAYIEADSSTALDLLADLGRRGVGVSYIWDACESRNPRFRTAGFEALGALPDGQRDGHAEFLEAGIADRNGYVAVAAIGAAARLRYSSTAPAVRRATQSENHHVAHRAILALGQLGDERDARFLIEAGLNADDMRVAQRAVRALSALSRRNASVADKVCEHAEALLDRFGAIDSSIGWASTRAVVVCLRHTAIDDALAARLLDLFETSAGARDQLALTLAAHRVEGARRAIEEMAIIDPSDPLRIDLIKALGILGIDDSLETIEEIAHRPCDTQVRAAIIDVVSSSVDPRADAIILDGGTGADITARAHTLRSLPERHGLLGELAVMGLTDPAPRVRIAAAERLAGRPSAREAIAAAICSETDPDVLSAFDEALNAIEADDLHTDPTQFDPTRVAMLSMLPNGEGATDAAVRTVALGMVAAGASPEGVAEQLRVLAAAACDSAERIAALSSESSAV